ncbi:WD repeat-containing protein 75 [Anabrus simplex]|uniref:WD repeat-containing protein 75 n=1 Tax=Anabrus simplex TaxID=316456 RepID=UPI0035A287E2
MESKNSEFVVKQRGGGSVIKRPPVFSLDTKTLFVVWGQTVRSYNAQTGEFIRNYEGLDSTAIGVHLNPNNPDHLVACSDRGELIEWNWKKGVQVRKLNLDCDGNCVLKSFHLFGHPGSKKNCSLYGVLSQTGKTTLRINMFCFTTGKLKFKNIYDIELWERYHNYAFGGEEQQPFVAGIFGRLLQVALLSKDHSGKKQSVKCQHKLTCVACHPKFCSVLVGDKIGRVLLWHDFFNSTGTKPVYTEYHWHTLPVRDIVFSSVGSHFYSGGAEGVLVKWTVEAPNQKKFLPRLPATVVHLTVAPENLLLAISTLDNAIQLVDTSLRLVSVIQHFSWSAECVRRHLPAFPAGLSIDPRSEALVLNGGTGHVQFFSLLQNTLLYQVNVTGLNILTQEREKVIVNTDVIRLALSSDGMWMATVEQRDDKDSSPELRLKFWQYNDEKQTYSLNTSIENPHKSTVYTIEFQPSSSSKQLMAVTTGDDLKFRLWSLVGSSSIYKKGQVWQNESVGFFRNLPVQDASFSDDSSLLAATFGPTLTVWISDICEMKCSLTRSVAIQHELTHVEFGHNDCMHLVVTGSRTSIAVWNLLSLSLMWTVDLHLSLLISDHKSSLMAAFTSENDLVLFSPLHSEPVHKQSKLITDDAAIVGAVFAPSNKQHRSQLYFANSKWELFTVENTGDELKGSKAEEVTIDQLPIASWQPLTPFGALMAQQTTSDVKALEVGKHQMLGIPGAASVRTLLASPAHTTAPMSLLCGSVLLALVRDVERPSVTRNTKDVGADDDSGIVSSDEDEDSAVQTSKLEVARERVMTKECEVQHRHSDIQLADLENKLSSVLEEPFDWTEDLLTK